MQRERGRASKMQRPRKKTKQLEGDIDRQTDREQTDRQTDRHKMGWKEAGGSPVGKPEACINQCFCPSYIKKEEKTTTKNHDEAVVKCRLSVNKQLAVMDPFRADIDFLDTSVVCLVADAKRLWSINSLSLVPGRRELRCQIYPGGDSHKTVS